MAVNGYSYDLLEYYPIAPGSYWNYDFTFELEGQTTIFGSTKKVHQDYEIFNGTQVVPQAFYTSEYADMSLINERSFATYDSTSIYYHGWEQVGNPSGNDEPVGQYTFTPPIILKRDMDVGESHTSSTTVTDPNGGTASFSMTITLVDVESIEVPANYFVNCLKIQVMFSGEDPGLTEFWWWAKGVGEVKNILSEPGEIETSVLTSYVIAGYDSDNDGLPDDVEDANHNGIVDSGETDPLDPDSDDDNFTDAEELICGSNPTDSSSVCYRGLSWLMLLLDD